MRGEQAAEADAVAEQHVADLLGLAAVGQLRALVDTRDLLQRAGKARGLAGELHRRRVGQRFARAADAGLDHAPEQQPDVADRSEEHTSELQSLMRISYAVFCLQNKNTMTT